MTTQAEVVRLVLGPEGEVLVDLTRRLDGRGAWVHPRPECVAGAALRGLARSFRTQLRVTPETLWADLRAAGERRAFGLLSAAWRARKVEVGSDPVRDALAAKLARLLVVATDARAAAETPWVREAVAAGLASAWGTKEVLGRAMGRAEVGVLAITDDGLAEALSFTLRLAQMPAPARVGSRNAPAGGPPEDG